MFGLYIHTGPYMAGIPNAVKFGQGQKGNPAGCPPQIPKRFEAALARALLRPEGKEKATALDAIACALIREAKAGNIQAIKEIAERSDGKVAQAVQVTGENGGPIQTTVKVEYVRAAQG